MLAQSNIEQQIVASMADAERRLMQVLVASHGQAFALAFRMEYAQQIASILRQLAQYELGKEVGRSWQGGDAH